MNQGVGCVHVEGRMEDRLGVGEGTTWRERTEKSNVFVLLLTLGLEIGDIVNLFKQKEQAVLCYWVLKNCKPSEVVGTNVTKSGL